MTITIYTRLIYFIYQYNNKKKKERLKEWYNRHLSNHLITLVKYKSLHKTNFNQMVTCLSISDDLTTPNYINDQKPTWEKHKKPNR